MRALAALCIRRPVFTWVLILSTVVLGLSALGKMPIERFPNIEFAFVSVVIPAPGMSAEQVESEISTRVENALGTVSGLDRLDSFSQEGMAMVWAQFVLSKDAATAANEVRDRVSRLGDELPRVARPPRIETFNANASPILLVAVDADPPGARTPLELTEIADTLVRRELQTVSGVGDVKLVGGETRALSIVLDPLRLRALDLTAQEVQRALERENLEAPGGSLPDGDTSLGVRLSAKAATAAELSQVVVAKRGELSVRLSDLGHVVDGTTASDSRASLSGRPGVLVTVTKQPGQNTVGVADEVRDRLETLKKILPDGVRARVIQDNSADVRAAVHAVTEHLIIGSLLAAFVVLLFLRSWRATLIAGLAIPASIIGSFAAAHALDITLNLLSLLGLTLAVGIVIDDAIVVLENIVRVMGEKQLSAREAAAEATREIGLAVLATTLSLVAVFLPVATMEGIVGRYLAPFSLTMSVSILLSMAVAFTLTPMLSSRWLKPEKAHGNAGANGASQHGHGQGRFEHYYGRLLGWSLRRRWVIGIGILITFASIFPVAGSLPATFIPAEDLGRFSVYVRLPDRASVDRTAQVAEELAARIRDLPTVSSTAVMTLSNRDATVSVYLDRPGVQVEMIKRVRDNVRKLVPADVLTMVGPMDDFAPPGPDSAPIQYVIRGSDLSELRQVAGRLLESAKDIPGTVDHGITSAGGKPELSLVVDRAHASKLGVSHAEIGSALALVDRQGVELGTVRDPRSKYDLSLKVRLRVAADTMAPEDLVRTLTVRSEQGTLIPLAELAGFARKEGPGLIRRVGRQRQITLFMNTVPGTSEAAVVSSIEQKLAKLEPTGRYRGEVIGNAKEMQKAATAFLVAIVLSFLFMYLILAAQFESWIHPVTILMSLPLTVPFGLVSLMLGAQTLNVFSSLGFLVLFGVVKKNSILQVDRIIQLRAEGLERSQAVIQACRDRLRPILMTTLAFVAGMLPLVISTGPGAATNRAVSVGILGGQTLSLALTLVATPVVYTFFDDCSHFFGNWRERRRNKRAGGADQEPKPPKRPELEQPREQQL
jgi:HAE1 family hydrophobic/amphiphilic exporter-1